MKHAAKLAGLLIAAPLMMGNQGCEQQVTPKRELKRQISLGKITSQKINFPGAENFDFEYVVNAQIYDAISKNDRFVVAFNGTDPVPTQLSTNDLRALSAPGSVPVRQSTNPLATSEDPNNCVARQPLLKVSGQIRSFEVVGGGGFWFGFRQGEVGNGSMGGSTQINVQTAQMELGLVGFHPMSKTVYGTGFATPKHTKADINLAIDFGTFSLGPSFFFQSRLAGVTMNGLQTALTNLADDLDNKATNEKRPLWETRVVRDYDTHVTIKAGRRHGIQMGDEFAVYNLDHYWEDDGAPCRSRYLGSVRNSDQPIAILKAVSENDLGDEFARLEVISQDSDGTRRKPGAQVVLYRFAEEASASTQSKATATKSSLR